MAEPFVGEIRMFAGTFAPRGWASCDGQLLAVSQNDALFSLLGTIYGGDGRTTFGLPDLRGRIPIHAGSGPGLSQRRLGEIGGAENVTLTANELPSHTHPARCFDGNGTVPGPQDAVWARSPHGTLYSGNPPDTAMSPSAIQNTGGSQSHDNMMPYQCIHFIIALLGIYPSRN